MQILLRIRRYIQSELCKIKKLIEKDPWKNKNRVINIAPKNNWYREIIDALCFLINNPFNTENKAAKKDEIRAYTIPNVYWDSKLKIIYNPPMTIIPKKISVALIFLLKKKGSISDVKKAPVLMATNAT